MSRFILRLGEDQYMEWSSIAEGPSTYILTKKELKQSLRLDAIQEFQDEFKRRMMEVEEHGTSCRYLGFRSVKDIVTGNRAGPDETTISLKQIKEIYKSPKTWKAAKARKAAKKQQRIATKLKT